MGVAALKTETYYNIFGGGNNTATTPFLMCAKVVAANTAVR